MADISVRLVRDFLDGGYNRPPGTWLTMPEARAEKLVARGIAEYGPEWDGSAGDDHVLMVSIRCDSRVSKMAAALRQRGFRVDLLGSRIPQIPDAYDMIRVEPEESWPRLIAKSGAAIIHVHNEPNRPMRYASEGARGRPVIFDIHDMEWHVYGHKTDDEDFSFDRADALIHTSKEYRKFSRMIGYRRDIPEGIVHTCPMRAWTPQIPPAEERNGIVYEGASYPRTSDPLERFRNHTEVAKAFEAKDMDVTWFVNQDALGAYRGTRLMVPYSSMLQRLPAFRWGFLGMDVRTYKWDVVIPNKLFEYLMCGLPVLAVNAPAVARYMDGRAGIYASSMAGLFKQLGCADWDQLAAEALAARRYMDDEIEELVMVYTAVLGKHACPICGKLTKSDFAMRGHIRQVHTGEWAAWAAANPT